MPLMSVKSTMWDCPAIMNVIWCHATGLFHSQHDIGT